MPLRELASDLNNVAARLAAIAAEGDDPVLLLPQVDGRELEQLLDDQGRDDRGQDDDGDQFGVLDLFDQVVGQAERGDGSQADHLGGELDQQHRDVPRPVSSADEEISVPTRRNKG